MRHTEGHFTGARARRIYHQAWFPEYEPRGLFLLVHGLGEHSGRYHAMAQHFVNQGWAVATLDHNGHGKSEGVPGCMQDIDDFVADVHRLRMLWHEELPEVPLFLLGHSLGGLISSLYLAQHQAGLAGAVLSGSLIRTPDHPGVFQRRLISMLAAIVPRLGLVKLAAAGVSRDARVVQEYEDDPLVFHGRMAVGQLREMFAAMDRVPQQAGTISLPLLILHGAADRMTAPQGSRLLHESVSSSDKTLTLYPGLYHEIFNEPQKQEVYADVLAWCEQRLPGR